MRHSFTWLCSGSIHCRLQRHSFTWHLSSPFDSHFRVSFLLTYGIFLLGVFQDLFYSDLQSHGFTWRSSGSSYSDLQSHGFTSRISDSFYSDFWVLFILTYSFVWLFGVLLLLLLLFVVVVVVLLFCVCVVVVFKNYYSYLQCPCFIWPLSGLFILAYNGIVLLGGIS